MSTEFTYIIVTFVNKHTSNPNFYSNLSNLNTSTRHQMNCYSTSNPIGFNTTLPKSDIAYWTLEAFHYGQDYSTGTARQVSVLSKETVAQGISYGSGYVDLSDIICRHLNDSSVYPAFNAVPWDESRPEPVQGIMPSSGIETMPYDRDLRVFVLPTAALSFQYFRFSYDSTSTSQSYYIDFCVYRSRERTFNVTNPLASSTNSNDLTNQGVFPMMLNQNTSAPAYTSDYSQALHADITFSIDANKYNANAGVYLFASDRIIDFNKYSDLTDASTLWENDLERGSMRTTGLVLIDYFDNYSSTGTTDYCIPGKWMPYATVECRPQDFIGFNPSKYCSIVDSADMPVWDAHKGLKTTSNQPVYLSPLTKWHFGIIALNKAAFSSSMTNAIVKTFWLQDLDYTWAPGPKFSSCKQPSQVCIRYENLYGATDQIWCNGTRTIEASREPQTYIKFQPNLSTSHSETVYQQSLSYRWTLNTPVMTDEDSKKLINLFSSKRIWIYDDTLISSLDIGSAVTGSYTYQNPTSEGLIPVVLEDTSMTVKTKANDKVFNYTFVFRSANPKTLY